MGIGTTAPAEKLVVSDGGAAGFEWIPSSGRWYRYNRSTSAYGGIYSEASEFTWSPYGSEAMRINGSGNVGIGTTSPGRTLNISSNGTLGTQVQINGTLDSAGIKFIPASGDNWEVQATTSNQWIVYNRTDEAYRLLIDGSGNVGIGTTAPASKLQVSGTGVGAPLVAITETSTAGNQYSQLEFGAGNRRGYIWLGNENTSSWAGAGGLNIYTSNGNMDLWTSGVQRVRIDTSGNVGIGTSAPSYKLEVNGLAAADRYILNSVPTNSFQGSLTAIAGDSTYNILAGPANGPIIRARWSGGTANRYLEFGQTDNGGNYTAGVRIVEGNVGIGTTAPGARLHVDGSVVITNNNSLFLRDTANNNGFQIRNTSSNVALIFQANNNALRYRAGFSSNSANAHIFAVGADTEIVRFTNDGNVGIGTTAPTNTLDIAASQATLKLQSTTGTNTVFARLENTAGTFYIGRDNSTGSSFGFANAAILYETGANPMVFVTNSAERMRITAAGNVGIGTTSPASSLHIASSSGVIFGTTAGTVGTSQITTASAGSPVSSRFAFGTDGTGWQYRIAKNTAGTIVDLITISDTGNVGIGTTSPSEKLHVDGNAVLTYNNSYQGINSIGNKAILARVSPTTGIINYAEYATATNLNGFVMGSTATQLKGIFATNKLEFTTNSSTRMTITSGGLVGIGTTSPSHILHITDVMRMDNVSAYSPNLSLTSSPKYGYGDVSNDRYLAEPAIWLKINVDGTEYVIPGYTEVI